MPPDPDTSAPAAAPGIDVNALLQQLLGGGATPPPPQVQNVNLAATRPTSLGGILGEALAGGPPTDVPLSAQQRDAAGRRALLSASIGMMNVGPFASIGQGIGAGLSGAMASQAYSEAVEAERQTAAQDWQTKQQALQLERLKEALPLLQLQRLQGIPSSLGGGAPPLGAVPPTASVGATSNAADFTSKFTPIAQTIATKTGLPLSYVLSQAGLETGWGSSAGARNNNFFGITDPATGKLMSYATPEAGAQAYIDLMASDRYKGVPRTGTPQQIGDAMALAGYNPNVPKKDSTDSYGARIGGFAAALPKPGTTVAAAGPPGAPRPYQVASAGPVPPPSQPPSTTLPVPPAPPAGGIPIPGGQGLVLKPDGTIGTPGGGFKGTPVAAAPPPPATTTPTGPPAPQPTTQAEQPTPPPGVPTTPPTQAAKPWGAPTFSYNPTPPPPGIIPSAGLTPDEQRVVDTAYRSYSSAIAAAMTPEQRQQAEATLQSTLDKELGARTGRTQQVIDATKEWYANDYKQQQTAFQSSLDNYYKLQQIQTTSDVQAGQKALEAINTTTEGARDVVNQLDLVRELSQAAGTPAFYQLWPAAADNLVRLGLLSPQEVQNLGAQRGLDSAINKLTLAIRAGSGFSRMSNMDLHFLQNTAPSSFAPEQLRTPMISFLQTIYERQLQYGQLVNSLHAGGMPVYEAQQKADEQLGPVVPRTPSFNGDVNQQGQWILRNVTPGSFYVRPDGRLAIRGSAAAAAQPQQSQ